MITINSAIEAKQDLNIPLTKEMREKLLEENRNAPYSYQCLLKEMLGYRDMTLRSVLGGWGGVRLVNLSKEQIKALGLKTIRKK